MELETQVQEAEDQVQGAGDQVQGAGDQVQGAGDQVQGAGDQVHTLCYVRERERLLISLILNIQIRHKKYLFQSNSIEHNARLAELNIYFFLYIYIFHIFEKNEY